MPTAFIARNRNRPLPPPVVRSYDDLKAVLNDRRIPMSMEILDHRIGWASGYAGKVFGKTRTFSLLSLGEILQALGIVIVVIPEDEQSPLGCKAPIFSTAKGCESLVAREAWPGANS
jgi:hypothetical protein